MSNLNDYINWRKDVPISLAPYNDADYYILSKIGTMDYSGIVEQKRKTVSLQYASEEYFKFDRHIGALASPFITEALKVIPYCVRYKDIRLCNYCDKSSETNIEQFSALTLMLPGNVMMVTFRGTDDTLNAWKEDLQMAVKYNLPAQIDAADYLNSVAKFHFGPIIVAGHSKGGNLAVYASSNATKSIQKKITAIYSFDGPGFHDSFYSATNYEFIRDKLYEVVPNTSIVGMMLTKEKPLCIVRAEHGGIASHDGYQWKTTPAGFEKTRELDNASKALHEATEDVLSNMSREEVSLFINEFFEALGASGAKTITEISHYRLSQIFEIFRKLQDGKQVKTFAVKMAENLVKCIMENSAIFR